MKNHALTQNLKNLQDKFHKPQTDNNMKPTYTLTCDEYLGRLSLSITAEYDLLIDNQEYLEYLGLENPEDYIVLYSYVTDLQPIANSFIKHGIEFRHINGPLSDESFLLFNFKQEKLGFKVNR